METIILISGLGLIRADTSHSHARNEMYPRQYFMVLYGGYGLLWWVWGGGVLHSEGI